MTTTDKTKAIINIQWETLSAVWWTMKLSKRLELLKIRF